MPATTEVQQLSTDTQLASAREDWNRLADTCDGSDVFLRHEWFDAAWQWRKADSRLCVLGIYRAGGLIGLCPLILVDSSSRLGPVRTLAFLTVPDTQLCDIITSSDNSLACVNALANWLAEKHRVWDRLNLTHLPAKSRTISPLCEALASRGLRPTARPRDKNYSISLKGSWEDFYKTRSRRLKKGNNLIANRLKRAGELGLERLCDNVEAHEALSTTVALSAKSWKKTTGLTFDNPAPRAFIERLTTHAATNGWLSTWVLKLDGVAIGAEYQLKYAGSVHALRADFDDNFSELSPGAYLNWKVLESLFQTDSGCYYLGPGANPYKLRWTDTGEQLMSIAAFSRTVRGHCHFVLEHHLRPRAQTIRSAVKLSRLKGNYS